MTPTDFEFTMTMPGDARLIGAVRQLAAQVAGYTQLAAHVSERLALLVERATETAVGASVAPNAAIHVRFAGDGRAIDVVISSEAAAASRVPVSSGSDGVTVDWQREGTRQICHIRQPLAS